MKTSCQRIILGRVRKQVSFEDGKFSYDCIITNRGKGK